MSKKVKSDLSAVQGCIRGARYSAVLIILCITALPLFSFAQAKTTTVSNRRQFQEIAAKLDAGGDLFLVVNTDKVIDKVMDAAINADVGIPADDPNEKEVRESIERVRTFLVRNGFSAIHGAGISSVPQEDGSNSVKMYISRDYIDSNLPLWRGLVGWQPRRLISLDFIPADTVMARAGTPEPEALWKVIRAGIDEAAAPETKKQFNEWLKKTNSSLGMDLEDLLKSIRNEIMVAVRFSETEQSVFPTKSGLVTIPSPEFLIVVGSDNDILKGLVASKFSEHKITLNESTVDDVLIRSSSVKLPSLIPMQPTYASEAGFFLLGSTPDIVADALLAYRHKTGLISRPEFKKAFQGLSMVNNGIVYVSEEMGEIMSHIRDANHTEITDESNKHPASSRIIKQLLNYNGKPKSIALIIQNWKKGVMIMGSSSISGQNFITRLAAFPLHNIPELLCTTTEAKKKTLTSIFRNTLDPKIINIKEEESKAIIQALE
jgi:hypothetical protein